MIGTCVICHKDCRVEGHHRDYSRPLEVDLLCRRCHMRVHGAADILYSAVFHPSFANILTGRRHFLSLKDNRKKRVG